jgi:thiol-disulfide isomerase/thioredoxin
MIKKFSASFSIVAAMAVVSGCVPGNEAVASNSDSDSGETTVQTVAASGEKPKYVTEGRHEGTAYIETEVDLEPVYDGSSPSGDRDPMPEGQELPYFEMTLTDGSKVSSESLKDHVVLIDFWATWCGPCWEASPVMQAFSEEFKDEKFVVIGASVLENEAGPQPAVDYANEKGYTYPMAYGADEVHEGLGFIGVPTFILIDKDGKARRVYPGWGGPVEEFMREDIQQLLG